jgi:hypothetical protein
MHYNLLFNGCSHTQGTELEGKTKDFEYRNKYRYSHIISEKTGKTYDNIAWGGGSNNRIARTTIEWFESGNTCDFAIIQFTLLNRIEFVSKLTGELSLFGNSNFVDVYQNDFYPVERPIDYIEMKKSFEEYYCHVYNFNIGLNNFYKNLFLLEQYFEIKNIPYYFIKITRKEYTDNYIDVPWASLCKTHYLSIPSINGDILNSVPVGDDYAPDYSKDDEKYKCLNGIHPSELGHQKIANHIIKHAL